MAAAAASSREVGENVITIPPLAELDQGDPIMTTTLNGHAEGDIIVIYADFDTIRHQLGGTDPSDAGGGYVPMWFCTDMVTETRGIYIPATRVMVFGTYAQIGALARRLLDKFVDPQSLDGVVKFYQASSIIDLNGASPFFR